MNSSVSASGWVTRELTIKECDMNGSRSVLYWVLMCVIGLVVLVMMYTLGIPRGSGGRVHMPRIHFGYSRWRFMEDAALLKAFEEEITAPSFIIRLLDSRPEYSVLKEELLHHWKPVIRMGGDSLRLLTNHATEYGNVTLPVPYACQGSLYILRNDICTALRELCAKYNVKYNEQESAKQCIEIHDSHQSTDPE